MFCNAGHSSLVFFTGCFKILTDSNLPSLNSGLETEETWKLKLKLSQLS